MSQPDLRPSAAPSHQRRKAERPQELLAAALDLFVEKGFAATRAEEVTQRAGVSKGTLYLYYQSKEELLKAVIHHYLSSAVADGAEVARNFNGSAADALRTVLAQWWSDVLDSPASGVFKLIITEALNFPEIADFYFNEVVAPGERVIGELLQRGVDSGEFRPMNVPAAVHSIVLPMVMLCLHKHSLGRCHPVPTLADTHGFIQRHFELLLDGLLPRPEHRSPAPDGPT